MDIHILFISEWFQSNFIFKWVKTNFLSSRIPIISLRVNSFHYCYLCYVSLWPNKRQHVIYIKIYIYFFDGRLEQSGEVFVYEAWTLPCKLDDGRESAHWVTTGQASVNSGIFDLILPSNSSAEIWTCLFAHAISSHNWLTEHATSALFGVTGLIIIGRK